MPRDRWAFTVRRMRGRMRTAKIRDLTADEVKLAIDYLSTSFPPTRPVDLNDRLPRTLLEGKALRYRAVQYDISDTNVGAEPHDVAVDPDRKSTRLNSSHQIISYAVFCLKK